MSVHAHHHVVDADIVYKHGGSSFPEMSDKANYITTVYFVKLKPLQLKPLQLTASVKTASGHIRKKLVSVNLWG
ncbi:MAG: hypothetical protein AB7C92_07745 [Synergistaceae bacterium]